jgi:hypothetical protein
VARYNGYMFEVNWLGCWIDGQEDAFIFSAADSVDTRDLGGHVGCCERIWEPMKVKERAFYAIFPRVRLPFLASGNATEDGTTVRIDSAHVWGQKFLE